MRTEYILTKVRPIKKLFIIEHDDYDSFAKLFIEIQNEIDSIQNLILVNDNDLWSQSNKDFIKRSDPDIILNLSKLDDDKLSIHFGISSVRPITDHFKIARFRTDLFSFTRLPTYVEKFNNIKEIEFDVLSASKLENDAESLLACVNYGLLQEETKKLFRLSIFKKLNATYLSTIEDLIKSIFDNNNKFIRLTTEIGSFGGSGHGSSVYEIDYNSEELFNNKKKYFFVSEKNNFKTISFFWNIRSYYSYSKIAWIPIDFIKDIESLVDTETVFVCFDEDIKRKVKEQFSDTTIIEPERLYFRGRNERWTFFEHTQTISITDNEAIIQHPVEKSFSDIGSIGAFVLEIRGLKEFAYPKRRSIGKLFFPIHYEYELFAERFQRISELGLSKYVLEVSPLKANDISELIALPTFNEVIKHLFEDVGYEIKKTPKSSILEQTVNLLGGLSELNIISNKNVFDLLVGLTPKVRTENFIKKLLAEGREKITSDDVMEIIAEIKEKGAVNFPSVTLTVDEIVTKTSLKGSEKKKLYPILQKLYDQRVFLRGKYFACPSCSSNLWIQIDEINRVNYCIECSNKINLPIHLNDKQDSDYFRLNQLIVRAVDQGQLSTLLLLNLFVQQKYRAFDYQSNLEVFKAKTLITDIDLLIKIGNKIGIAECKSTSGFTESQVDELIKIAITMQCDFIAFSSLIDSTSQEVKNLVELLNEKSLDIPAFIFTSQSLFDPKSNMIQKHFELWYKNEFSKGAIVIP
jgi:hypothetical protein